MDSSNTPQGMEMNQDKAFSKMVNQMGLVISESHLPLVLVIAALDIIHDDALIQLRHQMQTNQEQLG